MSLSFSNELMVMLKAEGCILEGHSPDGSDDMLDVKILRSKIADEGTIDIEVFNQLLKQDCVFAVQSAHYKSD